MRHKKYFEEFAKSFQDESSSSYALGKQTETITQEEIEKAAEKYADEIKIPVSFPGVMVPFFKGLAHDSYMQGAQDFLGKQDNVATSEPNVDSLAPNVDSLATSSASLSQNPAENCDNENHISKSERLHIAARLLQGLLANAVWVMRKTDLAAKAASDDNTKAAQILTNDLAEDALEFADALIKQAFLK